VRIEKLTIKNYRFFADAFALDIGGENVLLYGENGTGKSSIYRAMELLAGEKSPYLQSGSLIGRLKPWMPTYCGG